MPVTTFNKYSQEYFVDIAAGKIPGHSLVHKFGRNGDVASNTEEGVLQAAAAFTFRTSATTFRVKAGGNAADDTAGAGAQTVTIQGIDDSLNEVTEVLTTAGTSASSASSTSFWRVHRAWASAVGAYGAANTGNIVIEDSASAADHIMIAAGEGQTQYAAFTIPTGKTGYLLSLHGSVDAAKEDAVIKVFTRENFTDVTTPFSAKRLKLHYDGVTGFMPYTPLSPELTLPALTDIWVNAVGGSAGASSVSVDFEILLVDD